MTPLVLEPSDVLFFRDGRPISNGLAGHGAAWPFPTVINAALHAALHRVILPGTHSHDHRTGPTPVIDAYRFGSLTTAGPFPVREHDSGSAPSRSWYFPRPLDVRACPTCERLEIILRPTECLPSGTKSSLAPFLRYAAASCRPPAKEKQPSNWLEATAFDRYLEDDCRRPLSRGALAADRDIFLPEFAVGIGMDPARGTQDGDRIYSAHYMRLHSDWRLGLVAGCEDKSGGDLIAKLFSNSGPASEETQIVVGGQQRVCTARRLPATSLPLPKGIHGFKRGTDGRCRIKWVLLTPAIWPVISNTDGNGKTILDRHGNPIRYHPGGWLPNWIHCDWDRTQRRFRDTAESGKVLLEARSGEISRDYSHPKHKRVSQKAKIAARLVAAIVPKAAVVTGYALGQEQLGDQGQRGAKPTHLAVPAGAVYYFETEGANAEREAAALANALNWHGEITGDSAKDFTAIKHRRSTLFGEKGFGLGVCGTWQFHDASPQQPRTSALSPPSIE